jgi:hypothetical protein
MFGVIAGVVAEHVSKERKDENRAKEVIKANR